MPAYSFNERFIPMVMDGSKPHTIRKRRKKGFAKEGDTLYLYYGLRTKWCRKLKETKCVATATIVITQDIAKKEPVVLLFDRRLRDDEFEIIEGFVKLNTEVNRTAVWLGELDKLAWKDGFRPDGTTLENPHNARHLFYKWWKQTHEFPFIGDIIYWNSNTPSVRTCRSCGCTDNNCLQCIQKQGYPCHWVEKDLCSCCKSERGDQSAKNKKAK